MAAARRWQCQLSEWVYSFQRGARRGELGRCCRHEDEVVPEASSLTPAVCAPPLAWLVPRLDEITYWVYAGGLRVGWRARRPAKRTAPALLTHTPGAGEVPSKNFCSCTSVLSWMIQARGTTLCFYLL